MLMEERKDKILELKRGIDEEILKAVEEVVKGLPNNKKTKQKCALLEEYADLLRFLIEERQVLKAVEEDKALGVLHY